MVTRNRDTGMQREGQWDMWERGQHLLGQTWRPSLCLQVPALSQLGLKWSDLQNASASQESDGITADSLGD